MSKKNGANPATIALSYEQRDILRRLTANISPLLGKPATYGEAIVEAEKIVREHLARKAKDEVAA